MPYKVRSLKGSTSNVWSEAAVVLAMLGNILSFFALIGTQWSVRVDASFGHLKSLGLWHSCVVEPDLAAAQGHTNITICTNVTYGIDCAENVHYLIGGWHVACQILYTLGVAVSCIAMVILIVFQCCSIYRQTRSLLIAFLTVQTLGGVLTMSAAIVFSQHTPVAYPDCGQFRLDWAFHVAATATAVTFISVALAAVQLCCLPLRFGETQRLQNESESSTERRSGFDDVNVVQMELPPGIAAT